MSTPGVLVLVWALSALASDRGAATSCSIVQGGGIAARLPLSGRPFGAAINPEGVAYITRVDAAALARIDLPASTFSAAVTVGSVPTDVGFNPSGTLAYVANQFSHNVSVVDVATNRQVSTISVVGDPFLSRVSPDGRLLWISSNVDSLFAIDLATGEVAHRFGFPWVANGLAFHPFSDSLVYASVIDGAVREINFKRNAVLRTFTLGGRPQAIAVAPDASELYVANEGTRRLEILNLWSGATITAVALGGAPFDLQLTPARPDMSSRVTTGAVALMGAAVGLPPSRDRAEIWVSVTSSGEVKVLDRVRRTVLRTITTGGRPRRIAVAASGSGAVVANEAGWVDIVR